MITMPYPENADLAEQSRKTGLLHLRAMLGMMERHDTDYDTRYHLVIGAISAALSSGYKAGFRIDPSDPEWPVAYIELPTGQVSWHMPQHPQSWDGHSTEEKYRRIREFVEG